jgi:hypothetical protein
MELPKPEVLRCFAVRSFDPPLPAMELSWDADDGSEHTWHLPDNLIIKGPPPSRFGITVHRLGKDAYRVQVLWNRLSLGWDDLTRVQVMSSSLSPVLQALGTDLWYLLNQAMEEPLARAA